LKWVATTDRSAPQIDLLWNTRKILVLGVLHLDRHAWRAAADAAVRRHGFLRAAKAGFAGSFILKNQRSRLVSTLVIHA